MGVRKIRRLLLVGFLLMLLGCERVLVPLDEQEASLEQGKVDADPILVRMAVCWSGLPLARDLTAAYTAGNPRVSVDIVACDTAVANDLLAGEQVDLALVSEVSGCDEGEDQPSMILALDALVVVVSQQSPLKEIARDDLSALFAGYYLDWQELSAGRGRPELVVRKPGSTARDLFQSIIMEEQIVTSAAVVMPHDDAVLEYVSQHPNAVGYISRAYANEEVKVLAINGVAPTREVIREGEYPLVYCLSFKTSDAANSEARDFAAFVRGRGRQRLIAERYVIPD